MADARVQVARAMVALREDGFGKIVEELVDNAVKFSEPGIPIELRMVTEDGLAVLSVTDGGRGMSADEIAQIGAYVQFGRHLYEQQGLGLGLMIARRLVDLAGGWLGIESEPHVRTTITMRLPLVKARSDRSVRTGA